MGPRPWRPSIDPTTGRPLLQFPAAVQGFGNIQYNEFGSSTSYHSMQTQLTRRFSRGLMFGAAWTWSKTMDLVDGTTCSNPFVNPRVWITARRAMTARTRWS